MNRFARALIKGIALMLVAVSATPAADRDEARLVRTSNGLRIVTREAFERDLVALCLYVDGGNRTETAPLSGLSHYYEHLIFRGGTARQKELETRRIFQEIGEFGGWTGSDNTCYSFVVPAARFEEALDRFADAVLNVDVTAEKVAKEREVVLSEFKMSYADSPGGWTWYNLMRTAFRVHPYGRTTIGLRDVIEHAELDRFRTFYAERYVPNHMVVSVVGAIPRALAVEKVEKAFAQRERGRDSFETGEAEPPQGAARAVVEARQSEKSHAMIGWRAPAARADDAPAVAVLAHLLGGGDSSRLEREVRAGRGLVLEIGAWYDETRDEGLLGASFSTEPGRELEAVSAVATEAARLRAEPASDEELARARRKIEADYLLANQSYPAQANRLCWFALMEDPALGASYVDRLRGVSAHDVREAARRYIVPTRASISLVVPQPKTASATPTSAAPTSATPASAAPASAKPAGTAAPTADATIAALLAGDAAASGSARSQAARSGDTPARPAPRTVVRRLPDGMLVIAREDRSAPVISASIRYVDPTVPEPPGKPGVAALAERLLMRGTAPTSEPPLTRAATAARIDSLGIRIATGLDLDALTGSLEAPADRFADGLSLMLACLRAPSFEPEEVEKARVEQIAAIEAALDDGFGLAGREQYAALYEGTRFARPIDGTREGVRAALRDDLVRWHRAATAPRRAIVALVGAIEPEDALAELDRALAASVPGEGKPLPEPLRLTAPPAKEASPAAGRAGTAETPLIPAPSTLTPDAPETPRDLEPPPPGRARDRLIDRPKEQLCFRLGHIGIAPTDPDWIPLAIGLRHLSSEVFFRFVYEKGVAYRAWTHLAGGRRAHPFTFEMGVTSKNFPESRAGLVGMLEALVAKGLTPAEVEKAKRDLVARHLLGQQTALAQSELIARYEANGVGWKRADELPALVEATTADAVNAAVKRHLEPQKLTLIAVGDLAAAGLK